MRYHYGVSCKFLCERILKAGVLSLERENFFAVRFWILGTYYHYLDFNDP
jgi:hypothetical protein